MKVEQHAALTVPAWSKMIRFVAYVTLATNQSTGRTKRNVKTSTNVNLVFMIATLTRIVLMKSVPTDANVIQVSKGTVDSVRMLLIAKESFAEKTPTVSKMELQCVSACLVLPETVWIVSP